MSASKDRKIREMHAEIERLTAERDALKLTTERLQQHNVTTWNAGHTLGLMAGQKALTQAQDALQRDAWGNTQLTEALLAAEAERDALRADADRYRWLLGHYLKFNVCAEALSHGSLDAAIDAAMQQPKEPSNG